VALSLRMRVFDWQRSLTTQCP